MILIRFEDVSTTWNIISVVIAIPALICGVEPMFKTDLIVPESRKNFEFGSMLGFFDIHNLL